MITAITGELSTKTRWQSICREVDSKTEKARVLSISVRDQGHSSSLAASSGPFLLQLLRRPFLRSACFMFLSRHLFLVSLIHRSSLLLLPAKTHPTSTRTSTSAFHFTLSLSRPSLLPEMRRQPSVRMREG